MQVLYCSDGREVLVDDEDYPLLKRHTWTSVPGRNTWYALTTLGAKTVMMHSLISPMPSPFHTDHWDGNGLNNQKLNLRRATISENAMNRGPEAGKLYKGTHAYKGKFRAKIQYEGKQVNLGTFVTEEEAAKRYDEAALEFHGKFAYLNFPLCLPVSGASAPQHT
jgi:hypothetical protein